MAPKKQAKAAVPKTKKREVEESKEGSHVEESGDEMEDSHVANDEEVMNKYGFRQKVNLELTLPTEEKEHILEHEMKFIDRNYQAKQFAESGQGHTQIGERPNALTNDYECNLSEVIVFLKKCGYPLENCFVSFWSPVFSAFINCGLDPLPKSIKLTKEDLSSIGKEGEEEKFKLHLRFIKGITADYRGDDEAGQ